MHKRIDTISHLPSWPPHRYLHSWSAQTNPTANNGWTNVGVAGGGTASKCAGNYVAERTLPGSGAKWNQLLGGKRYRLQGNWLNFRGGSCVLSGSRFNTGWSAVADLRDLASHEVLCPPASGLSLFRLQVSSSGNGTVWHNCMPYSDATVMDEVGLETRTTAPVDDQQGALAALVNVTVSCEKPQGVLAGWKVVSSVNQLAVQYKCAFKTQGLITTCSDRQTLPVDYDGTLAPLTWSEPTCERSA